MPCRISTGVHEGSNERFTVPAWNPVNPLPGEQSRESLREEKTPWSFTAACACATIVDAERSREPLIPASSGVGVGNLGTPTFFDCIANRNERSGTSAGGQFRWGGRPLKMYQGCPKVSSECNYVSELHE